MANKLLPIAICLLLPCICIAQRKVLLTSVKTLTLHEGKFTTGRRSSPVPQLRCVDGKARCKHLPSAVQCYNQGTDGIDVQWKCEATLPKKLQFDTLQVQCEGYDYPDDPYILAGSCGLTYSLKPAGSGSRKSHSGWRETSYSSSSSWSFSTLFLFGIALAAVYGIYKCCLASNGTAPSAPQDYEPPPPYTSPQAGSPPPYGFRGEFTGQPKYQQRDEGGAAGGVGGGGSDGRPGFWTGAAVGGLAGYLFGNSSSQQQQRHYGYRQHSYDSTHYARESSSCSSSGSDAPATSVGYASTRRR